MQRYYLKILNKIFLYFFAFFIILLSYAFLYLNLKKIDQKNNFFDIPKGSNLNQIVNSILINENYFNKKIYFYFLIIYDNFLEKIKYGEFVFDDNTNLIQITKTFSKPSNYYRDFKVIGGWNKYQLDELIKEKFNTAYNIPYNEIIADTYSYQSHNKIEDVFNWENRYIPDSEIVNYFSAADVVALPYKNASQSGVIQIAYHYDTPVVVTNVGGLSEMVDEGNSGNIIPPEDPIALAKTISVNLKNGNYHKMVDFISEYKNNFSWGKFIKGIESLVK